MCNLCINKKNGMGRGIIFFGDSRAGKNFLWIFFHGCLGSAFARALRALERVCTGFSW
jgi:hypothetical protein